MVLKPLLSRGGHAAPRTTVRGAAWAPRLNDPRKLHQLLRGELDWIVMRALEKDRARRYQAASGLARDIERYLADETVEACPPSRAYRLRKFARRNKAALVTVAAVLLAMTVGLALATVGFVQANRQRAIAQSNETKAKKEAARADLEAHHARTETDKAVAVNQFLNGMLAAANPWHTGSVGQTAQVRGKNVTVYDLLDKAARRLEAGSLKDRPEIEAAVRTTLGDSYNALGQFPEAEKHYRDALRLNIQVYGPENMNVVKSMIDLSQSLPANKLPERERLMRQALAMQRRLRGEESNEWKNVEGIAYVLQEQGKFAEAEELRRQVLAKRKKQWGAENRWAAADMYGLARVLSLEGKVAEADSMYSDALAMHRKGQADEDLLDLLIMGRLGELRSLEGRTTEAEQTFQNVLALEKKVTGEEKAETLSHLAGVLQGNGKFSEAEQLYRRAVAIDEKNLGGGDDPTLATRIIRLAEVLRAQEKLVEAQTQYERALPILRRTLGDEHDRTRSALRQLTLLLQSNGKVREAESLYREVLAGQRKRLGENHPNVAETTLALAGLLRASGREAEAAALDRQAIAMGTATRPAAARFNVASSELSHADALVRSQSYAEAETVLLELRRQAPISIRMAAHDMLIQLYFDWGKPETSSEMLQQRMEATKTRSPGNGHLVTYQLEYAQSLRDLKRYESAEVVLKEAHGISTPGQKPLVAQRLRTLYDIWGKSEESEKWRSQPATTAPTGLALSTATDFGLFLCARGKAKEAATLWQSQNAESVELASQVAGLGERFESQKRFKEAAELYRAALTIAGKKLPPDDPQLAALLKQEQAAILRANAPATGPSDQTTNREQALRVGD